MTGTVILEPMTAERYVSWFGDLVRHFAQDKIDSGSWPEAGAFERSAEQNAELLPQGVGTAGHHLFVGTVGGEEMGYLWLYVDASTTPLEAFIYDIEVIEGQRGRGLGRGLLDAGERWCAEHDVVMLRLHVFGFNTAAIHLYETSGFETTDLNMAKQIVPA